MVRRERGGGGRGMVGGKGEEGDNEIERSEGR